MAQCDMVFIAEVNHYFRLEGSIIVCDNFYRTTKYGQYIGFKELDNERVSSIPRRYGFYPLGKVISGSEDPLMLG